MLTEAAFVAVSTPGPMRAFYERVRTRRGSQIAIVAYRARNGGPWLDWKTRSPS
jgi:hypothetical protein